MRILDKKKYSITSVLLIFSFVVFGVSQLVVNSILTPLGTKLQSLNTEKEYLLEENRSISEDIAKSSSIKVVEKLSEKKLNIAQNRKQTVVYIEDKSLVANTLNE